MKIGIVTDVIDSYLRGGPAGYTRGLVESLRQLHSEIWLIHSVHSNDPIYQKVREFVIPFLLANKIPAPSFFAFYRPIILRKFKFDIIHYPDFRPPFTFRLSGSHNICTVHSLFPLKFPQYSPYFSRLSFKLWAFLNRQMDLIISISAIEKEFIQKYFHVPESKIKVIYPGINSIFRPLPRTSELYEELRKKFKIKKPYILYVGHYLPKKNLPILIQAYHKLILRGFNVSLVIVGKLLWNPQIIKNMVIRLGLEEKVLFLNQVSHKDLVKLYNCAELFVLPSIEEVFPAVVREAMACGTCVAISDNVWMHETAGNAAIYFDPFKEESIMEAIYQALTNSSLRTELITKGLKRVKQFSYERCAQETLKAYKEVLERSG